MSETPLSERQAGLLAVVAEGGWDWDARWIRLTTDARYGPGPGTVLRELAELQQLGLVVRPRGRCLS
jgi:hypothetical protein